MYKLKLTGQLKKDVKLCKKRGYPLDELWTAINTLLEKGQLPENYQTHPLHGKYEGCLECHIQPDWLLVWKQLDKELIMIMTNTGTHSDLF